MHNNYQQDKKTFYLVALPNEFSASSADAVHIAKYLEHKYNIVKVVPKDTLKIKNGLILFMDRHHYLSVWKKLDPSNIIITTWWHGWQGTRVNINKSFFKRVLAKLRIKTEVANEWQESGKPYEKLMKEFALASQKLYKIICSCDIAINRLVESHNIPKDKIVKIPIGIDLEIFKPVSDESEKAEIKEKLGLPKNRVIIGNFSRDTQVDGSPKWVKDPLTFVEVLSRVQKECPNIHILLTNQRRGFVKHHLNKRGIPFTHLVKKEHAKIADIYQATDLSLITSREEGGPKQLHESMASKVAVVSTYQGMAPEWLHDNENGFLCPIEDIDCLAKKTIELIKNETLRKRFEEQALVDVRPLSYEVVVEKYDQLLASLLTS